MYFPVSRFAIPLGTEITHCSKIANFQMVNRDILHFLIEFNSAFHFFSGLGFGNVFLYGILSLFKIYKPWIKQPAISEVNHNITKTKNYKTVHLMALMREKITY